MTVGQKLTELRKKNGYSRTALADRLGLPQTTLRNYETDVREPGHSFLIRMAQEFSVSIDYLLGLTEDSAPAKTKLAEEFSLESQTIAAAYDQADAGTQGAVRKLLDVQEDDILKECRAG